MKNLTSNVAPKPKDDLVFKLLVNVQVKNILSWMKHDVFFLFQQIALQNSS